jgi:hypothetical protein
VAELGLGDIDWRAGECSAVNSHNGGPTTRVQIWRTHSRGTRRYYDQQKSPRKNVHDERADVPDRQCNGNRRCNDQKQAAGGLAGPRDVGWA